MRFKNIKELSDFFESVFDIESTRFTSSMSGGPIVFELEPEIRNDVRFNAFLVMVKDSGYEGYMDCDDDLRVKSPEESFVSLSCASRQYKPFKRIV